MHERTQELRLVYRPSNLAGRLLDLQRRASITRAQRIKRAALWLLAGAAAAVAALQEHERRYSAVELLEPQIEHAGPRFTIYRLGFEWRGIEKSCRLVVFEDSRKWSLQC